MVKLVPAASLDLGEPLGEIVDVQGRAVHVLEMGAGSPTVWLENGWLGTTLDWGPFQDMLAAHTRVCAYDRAGNAWSDPSDTYRTAQKEADEFAALLDARGEDDPVILLAWSGGGPVAQIFAVDHPERVAGLVLMEGIPPGYDLWATRTYPDRYPCEWHDKLEGIRCFAVRASKGMLRESDIVGWITPETAARYGARYKKLLLNNPNFWWTYYWQNQYIIASGAQVQSKTSLGDLPLTVIVATADESGDDEYQRSLAEMWRAMQYPQARLSSRGRVVPVAAGHALFREQPQAVIDVVLDMMAEIRKAPDALPLPARR
ncbi:MAG: alpha/beta hydrolase [Anaerolineaceae bacterium]|nr:alpha/beta hydrolase [Anaerolineaceae bacterium]